MERYPTIGEVNAALTRHRARRDVALSRVSARLFPSRAAPVRRVMRAWFDEREAYLYSFIANGHVSGVAVAGAEGDRQLGAGQAEWQRSEDSGRRAPHQDHVAAPTAVAPGVAR